MKKQHLLFLLVLCSSILLSLDTVKASTYIVGNSNDLFVTVNINNTTSVPPGGSISVDGSVTSQASGGIRNKMSISAITVGNAAINLFPGFFDINAGETLVASRKYFTAPTTPGNYTVTFTTNVNTITGGIIYTCENAPSGGPGSFLGGKSKWLFNFTQPLAADLKIDFAWCEKSPYVTAGYNPNVCHGTDLIGALPANYTAVNPTPYQITIPQGSTSYVFQPAYNNNGGAACTGVSGGRRSDNLFSYMRLTQYASGPWLLGISGSSWQPLLNTGATMAIFQNL